MINNSNNNNINYNQEISKWFVLLPIIHDKEEGCITHEFLCELCINGKISLVLQDNLANLEHLIIILTKIYGTKLTNDDTDKMIQNIMKFLKSGD